MARKVTIEVEIPEGKSLEEILRGVKYRVIEDRVERLRKLFEKIEKKNVKVEKIPTREELYADRTRY